MTISATPAIVTYTGDAVTTDFSVPFEFFNGDDIRVRHYADPQDLETFVEYQFGTEYLTTGGDGATGEVQIQIAAPPDQSLVEIVSFMQFGQATAYGPHGPFPAEAHETALDRLAIQIKQVAAFVPGSGGGGAPGVVESVFGRSGDIIAIEADYAAFYADITHSHTWAEIVGKPSTFPPETHFHTWDSITGKPATFPPSPHTHAWGEITGKPSTFPPGGTATGAIQFRSTSQITGGNDEVRVASVSDFTGDLQSAAFDFYLTDGLDFVQVGVVGYDPESNAMLFGSDPDLGLSTTIAGSSIYLLEPDLLANVGAMLIAGPNGQILAQPFPTAPATDSDLYSALNITMNLLATALPPTVVISRDLAPGSGQWTYEFYITQTNQNAIKEIFVDLLVDGSPVGGSEQSIIVTGDGPVTFAGEVAGSYTSGQSFQFRARYEVIGGNATAPTIQAIAVPISFTILHYGTGAGISFLKDLLDVNVPAPSDGFSLVWVDAAQEWQAIDVGGGGGGAVTSIFGRTGVVIAVGTDYAAFYRDISYVPTWGEITSKPSVFPPDTHVHIIDDVTGLQTALDGKSAVGHTHDWTTGITGKPSTFPPEAHTHLYAEITDAPNVNWTGGESTVAVDLADVLGLNDASNANATIQNTLDNVLKAGLGKETVFIPSEAMSAVLTNGAERNTRSMPNSLVTRSFLDFDNAAYNYASWSFQLPESWNAGAIEVGLVWTSADTLGTGNTSWFLYGRAVSDGDQLDYVNAGGALIPASTISAAAQERFTGFAPLTLEGTPAKGDRAYFTLLRRAVDAEDTYTQPAALIGAYVRFTVDALNDS